MKIRVMLKDPDTMHDSVDDVFEVLERPAGISPEEWADIRADRASATKSAITDKWMEYGEYLMVEFDTDANTATVIPAKDYR